MQYRAISSLVSSSGSAALRVSRRLYPLMLCPVLLAGCGDDGDGGDGTPNGSAGVAGSSAGGSGGFAGSGGSPATGGTAGTAGNSPATPVGDGGVGECNASLVESPPTSALHVAQ